MVDFNKLLSPESKARLQQHRHRRREHEGMDDVELIQRIEYSLANMELTKYQPGDMVYDATFAYIQFPELLGRFKEQVNYYAEIKMRHHFTCGENTCSPYCEKEAWTNCPSFRG